MTRQVVEELLRRTEASESLIKFTEWTFERYQTSAHHRIIAGHLERVERGEIDRLMLLVPPRHGKSELASRRFPAFYLGRHPAGQIASCSASAELASDFGRDVRNLIQSQEYKLLFDTRLAEDSAAKNKWHTQSGGVYYSLGVGGQFMGRGADVLLIDDPFANMADAQSELSRKAVWDWYSGTAYNRLQPGGAIIVINHRMHEDDLSGHLLAQQAAGGDKWEVVELPAISDAGEPLWPEAYPLEALERIKANTFSRYWSSLYQQRPAPEEGTYFLAEWIKHYDALPPFDRLRIYGASDYAVSDGEGDWTVHLIAGIDQADNIFILDIWRKQAASDVWVDGFCDMVEKWHPLEWAGESGQIKKSVGPFLNKRMVERKAYTYIRPYASIHDKPTRAQSIRGRMAMGKVFFPRYAPWLAEFVGELLAFDGGKNDDMVDAFGLIGRMMDRMATGKGEPKKPSPLIGLEAVTLDQLFKDHERQLREMNG